MKNHIPNAITISRFPGAIYVAYNLVTKPAEDMSSAVWIVAAIVLIFDWLDGKVARRLGVVSEFGKRWDPRIDKIVRFILLGSLCWLYPLILIPCLPIIARDAHIAYMRRLYERATKEHFPAQTIGKYKEWVIGVPTGILIMLHVEYGNSMPLWLISLLVYLIVAIFFAVTWLHYIKLMLPAIRGAAQPGAAGQTQRAVRG